MDFSRLTHVVNKDRPIIKRNDVRIIKFFDWLNWYVSFGGKAYYPSLLYFNYASGREFLISDDRTSANRAVGSLFLEVVVGGKEEACFDHDRNLIRELVSDGYRIKNILIPILQSECADDLRRLNYYLDLIR